MKTLGDLSRLPVVIDVDSQHLGWTEISRLAALHGLTAYDASYLELALRYGLPLATFDAALIAAACRENIEVL